MNVTLNLSADEAATLFDDMTEVIKTSSGVGERNEVRRSIRDKIQSSWNGNSRALGPGMDQERGGR